MNSYEAIGTPTNGQTVKLNKNHTLKEPENKSSIFFILEEENPTQTSTNTQEIYSVIMTDEIILNTDVYEVLEIDPIDQKKLALADLDSFYNKLSDEFENITEDSDQFEIIGEELTLIDELDNFENSFEELKVPSQDNVYELSYSIKLRELGGLRSETSYDILVSPNMYDRFADFMNSMLESLTTKASAKSIVAPFVLILLAIPLFFTNKANANNSLQIRRERAEKEDQNRIALAKVHNEQIKKAAKEYAESMKIRWIQHYERNCIKKYNSDQLEKTNTTITKIMEKLSEEVKLFPYRVRNEMRYLFNKLFF